MAEKQSSTKSAKSTKSTLGLVPPARTSEKTAAARPKAPRPPRPRFRLTRRATILLLAVCAVVVTIAYPLQEYLAQRSQLAAIDAQNSALSNKVTSLQQQIGLWNDPGYVAAQVRSQLHYVLPGEEGFTLPGTTIGSEQLGMPAPTASPWYDTLWGTVKSPGASSSSSSAGPSTGR
ncbi:septum formation initiator family protein [Actinospica sp.]|uniref:FtsB family cell division protein n=1 Tax=Actinospica sp. TaxID=1872142 RepID=UPI002B92E71E|nr:septum formation initiator family protein [Actinospica sp.]HWG27863.1 septum formation initiator family protein [Actinospica sp.]